MHLMLGKQRIAFFRIATESYDLGVQIEYVNLLSNQELLLKIIKSANRKQIVKAAVGRLDFDKQGFAYSFVKNGYIGYLHFGRFDRSSLYSSDFAFDTLRRITLYMTEDELLDLISHSQSHIRTRILAESLSVMTKSPELLLELIDDRVGDIEIQSRSVQDSAQKRLLSLLDRVNDSQTIEKILSCRRDGKYVVRDVQKRISLMKRLPKPKMLELISADIEKHNVHKWNEGDVIDLETALGVIDQIKDKKHVIKIVSSILSKIVEYRQRCENSRCGMSWGQNDHNIACNLMSKISLSELEIAALACSKQSSGWLYLIDKISPKYAYIILSKGKASIPEFEVALANKIPPSNIDIYVFNGARTDEGKKAIIDRMPDDVLKIVQETRKKEVAHMLERAESLAESTFELKGFYLGMSIQDAKKLVEYYLPKSRVIITNNNNIEIDPKKKEKLFDAEVDPQEMYFCQADRAGKVYRFNFDKRFLKQWFDYDVQDWHEWASEYARQFNCDFRLNVVRKNIDNEHYAIYVRCTQPVYRYRNNRKKFVVSYHGKLEIKGLENINPSDMFEGGWHARRVGYAWGADKRAREFFANGDGATEGTLRVECIKD